MLLKTIDMQLLSKKKTNTARVKPIVLQMEEVVSTTGTTQTCVLQDKANCKATETGTQTSANTKLSKCSECYQNIE